MYKASILCLVLPLTIGFFSDAAPVSEKVVLTKPYRSPYPQIPVENGEFAPVMKVSRTPWPPSPMKKEEYDPVMKVSRSPLLSAPKRNEGYMPVMKMYATPLPTYPAMVKMRSEPSGCDIEIGRGQYFCSCRTCVNFCRCPVTVYCMRPSPRGVGCANPI